jgi:hypothetical protein
MKSAIVLALIASMGLLSFANAASARQVVCTKGALGWICR